MRERWIDAWKGWLILLVVAGHVVGGGSHFAVGEARSFLRAVYFLIYSFHMPAFFFVAGWLWRRKGFKSFIGGRVRRLLVPYFVVGIVSAVIYSLMQGSSVSGATDDYYVGGVKNIGGFIRSLLALAHAGGWPDGKGFCFNSVLWFLPCLFTVEVVYWFLETCFPSLRSNLLIVIGLLLIGFMGAFYPLPLLPWGLSCLPRFLPWFIAGRIARAGGFLSARRDLSVIELFVVALLHSTLVWLNWNVVTGVSRYWIDAASIAVGIFLTYEIARCSAKSMALVNGLAILGMSSMSIMLWHKFVVVAAQFKVPLIKLAYGGGITTSAVVSAAITALAIAIVMAGGKVYDWFLERVFHK